MSRNDSISSNPFAALFPSLQDAEEYAKWGNEIESEDPTLPQQVMEEEVGNVEKRLKTEVVEESFTSLNEQKDDLIERIFLLTNDGESYTGKRAESLPPVCIKLGDDDHKFLHESIEQLIFERLLLNVTDSKEFLVHRHENGREDEEDYKEAGEYRPLMYLMKCFNRLLHEQNSVSPQLLPTIKLCRELIVRNIGTSLISPELFKESNTKMPSIHSQLYDILTANDCSMPDSPPRICLFEVTDFIVSDDASLLEMAMMPLMNIIYDDMKEDLLSDPALQLHLTLLQLLASHSSLAQMILDFKVPMQTLPQALGHKPKTILEMILGKSCLVTDTRSLEYEFFENVGSMGPAQVENEEYHIHNKTDSYHSSLKVLFRQLLNHKESRIKLLSWIGEYIAQNAYLAKMWTHEHWDVFMGVYPSDAIFLNLSAVLARLCLPFCSDKSITEMTNSSPKFLKIDPTYCAATALTDQDERNKRGVHGKDLHKDTCFQTLSKEEENSVQLSENYNFITECFFFTHRSLYLGIHGLINKFYKLNRAMNRLEGLYRDVRSSGSSSDDVQPVIDRFERGMRIYLSTKAVLTEPAFIEACMKLHASTNQYLIQIAVTEDMSQVAPVVLPFTNDKAISKSLFTIPEYIVENITDIVIFLWRFARKSLYLLDPYIHDFLLMISIYMGNKDRMSNPHLRASLAEVLQVVMPLPDNDQVTSDKEQIFNRFPYSPFLAIATLQLFVDIEFTGDPHQFEQKFNYRQPLYKILKYMWERRECRKKICENVKYSISHIDDPEHPLFLQFTNLLLNDSIFLLDEAMGFLSQIKNLEREKINGEWEDLDAREKQQKEAELQQLGMLARYHNVLSNDTMATIVYLTNAEEVKDLFCHPSLADRVAAMLDDFLLKLVGPKMGVLKVRDLSAYSFKPKVLVTDICRIYLNLCIREDFCRAISRDGRSYSVNLFPMAYRALKKIGEEDLSHSILEISERIKIISKEEEEEEEMYVDAPDEFYDSLMSTLMRDPVTLPKSKQVVDRSTISRHLMSDPTDPFNRAPLTMQEVIPNTELKNRINEWLEAKRKEKKNTEET